jgi:hypothetical protein
LRASYIMARHSRNQNTVELSAVSSWQSALADAQTSLFVVIPEIVLAIQDCGPTRALRAFPICVSLQVISRPKNDTEENAHA